MADHASDQKSAFLQVARSYETREDWRRARDEYQALAARFPRDPMVLEALARCEKKLGLEDAWSQSLSQAAACYHSAGLFDKALRLREKIHGAPTSMAA